MRALLLIAACLLPGCAAVFDGPRPARDEIVARIQLVADADLPQGRMGDAACVEGRCLIRIRRSSYPHCITHEIRHGFEPMFHRNQDSDESCYMEK